MSSALDTPSSLCCIPWEWWGNCWPSTQRCPTCRRRGCTRSPSPTSTTSLLITTPSSSSSWSPTFLVSHRTYVILEPFPFFLWSWSIWNHNQTFSLTAKGFWGDCVGKRPLERHVCVTGRPSRLCSGGLKNISVAKQGLEGWWSRFQRLLKWEFKTAIIRMLLCLLSVFPQLYFHMIRQRKKVLGHAEDYSKVEWPGHTETSETYSHQKKRTINTNATPAQTWPGWKQSTFFSPSSGAGARSPSVTADISSLNLRNCMLPWIRLSCYLSSEQNWGTDEHQAEGFSLRSHCSSTGIGFAPPHSSFCLH